MEQRQEDHHTLEASMGYNRVYGQTFFKNNNQTDLKRKQDDLKYLGEFTVDLSSGDLSTL